MIKNQYELFAITKQHFEEISNFSCQNYVNAQPVSLLLGTTPSQFFQAYSSLIQLSCTSGLSYGFRRQGKIVSIALVCDQQAYSLPLYKIDKVKPIQYLVQELQKICIPQDQTKTVAVFIVVTHTQHTKRGLCTRLLQQIEKKGIQKGIKQITATCTNPISQRIFVKSGFKIKGRIYYKEFQFQGGIPFKNIQGTESLSYVSKLL